MTFRWQKLARQALGCGAVFCLFTGVGCQTTRDPVRSTFAKPDFVRQGVIDPNGNQVSRIPTPNSPALKNAEMSSAGPGVIFQHPPVSAPVDQHVVMQGPATPMPVQPMGQPQVVTGPDGKMYLLQGTQLIPLKIDQAAMTPAQVVTPTPTSAPNVQSGLVVPQIGGQVQSQPIPQPIPVSSSDSTSLKLPPLQMPLPLPEMPPSGIQRTGATGANLPTSTSSLDLPPTPKVMYDSSDRKPNNVNMTIPATPLTIPDVPPAPFNP